MGVFRMLALTLLVVRDDRFERDEEGVLVVGGDECVVSESLSEEEEEEEEGKFVVWGAMGVGAAGGVGTEFADPDDGVERLSEGGGLKFATSGAAEFATGIEDCSDSAILPTIVGDVVEAGDIPPTIEHQQKKSINVLTLLRLLTDLLPLAICFRSV